MAIHGQRAEDEVRLTLLLEAIREEFGTSEQMFTADLVARLIAREGEPWATIKRNGAADRRLLPARHAEGRGRRATPSSARSSAARTAIAASTPGPNFEEAWARYISVDPANDPAHPAHPAPEPQTRSQSQIQRGRIKMGHPAPSEPRRPQKPAVGPDGAGWGDSSGATQAIDLAAENGAGPWVRMAPDQIRRRRATHTAGDGADAAATARSR